MLAADVDGEPGLGRERRPPPGDDVVLERARHPVVDGRAALERDPAAVREQPLVQGPERGGAAVRVPLARRLAEIAVGLEGGDRRLHVAGGEGAPVVADDVRGAGQLVGLQQRRADRVPAAQQPGAVVDPLLGDAAVGVVIAGDRHGNRDTPRVAVGVQDELLDPAARGDEEADLLGGRVVLGHPVAERDGEALERGDARDAPAHRMVDLGHAGERLDERADLPGPQAVEERDEREAAQALVLPHARQGGGGEELRRPGHRRDPTPRGRSTYRPAA